MNNSVAIVTQIFTGEQATDFTPTEWTLNCTNQGTFLKGRGWGSSSSPTTKSRIRSRALPSFE